MPLLWRAIFISFVPSTLLLSTEMHRFCDYLSEAGPSSTSPAGGATAGVARTLLNLNHTPPCTHKPDWDPLPAGRGYRSAGQANGQLSPKCSATKGFGAARPRPLHSYYTPLTAPHCNPVISAGEGATEHLTRKRSRNTAIATSTSCTLVSELDAT